MHASVCYYSELNSEDRSRAVLRGVSQGGPTLWYPNITSLQSEKAPWKLIYKLKSTSKVIIKPTTPAHYQRPRWQTIYGA